MRIMKTITLTNEELEILYDNLEHLVEDEEDNNSLSRDEDYIQALRQLWKKVIDAQQGKSSDDNSVPQYNCKGGEIERLTEEELKELGELLNTEISDYLDTSLVIVHEEGKQLAIRQANLYKRIYNKLIKPIYKMEE